MRILHTSDWHLGLESYGRSRELEQAQFLEWLLETIRQEGVELLLVAGDVFDSHNPGRKAARLYFDFLAPLAKTPCRQAVIIAGNHDSVAGLKATQRVLESLNVSVVAGGEELAREVIPCFDSAGQLRLVVGAVPYLRPGDLLELAPQASVHEDLDRYLAGYINHYHKVRQLALELRERHHSQAPLLFMGHLYVQGCLMGEQVRDLPVGNLQGLEGLSLEGVDYLALGHLHLPQEVAGHPHWRYSGSPLHFGAGELRAGRSLEGGKSVVLLDLEPGRREIELLPVPVWRDIRILEGDDPQVLLETVGAWVAEEKPIWLLLTYRGPEGSHLANQLKELIEDSQIELLKFVDERWRQQVLSANDLALERSEGELSQREVLRGFLEASGIELESAEGQWMGKELGRLLEEILLEGEI